MKEKIFLEDDSDAKEKFVIEKKNWIIKVQNTQDSKIYEFPLPFDKKPSDSDVHLAVKAHLQDKLGLDFESLPNKESVSEGEGYLPESSLEQSNWKVIDVQLEK